MWVEDVIDIFVTEEKPYFESNPMI